MITYLLMVSISLATVGVFFLRWMERSLSRRAETQLITESKIFAHFMGIYTQSKEDLPESTRWLMKEFPRLTRARVRIADANANILADSDSIGHKRNGYADLKALLEEPGRVALNGKKVIWSRENSAGRKVVHVTTPIILEYPTQEVVGCVDVSSQLSEIDSTFHELRQKFFWALGFAVFASATAALFLARTLTIPVLRIKQTAATIAQGDLAKRVNAGGAVELTQLGATINYMAQQLDWRMKQLEDERNKIHTLLESLPDPIFTVDNNNCVSYMNPAAETVFGFDRSAAIGQPLDRLWPDDSAVRSRFHPSELPVSQEIVLPPRIFKAYILPYEEHELGDDSSEKGRLFVLRDITDIRRLEEVRNLFLSSVSHELRTPLTIIKGFSSTLLELPETADVLKKPLQRIDREVDRLTRLVNDLLELTRMRSRKLALELELLSPDEVVKEAVDLLIDYGKRKGVNIRCRFQGANVTVNADKDRLKQVVINLLDNAIKFTPAGGIVTVSTETQEDYWSLTVKDTGPGIDPEDLQHLFEHFFRSKKSRPKVDGSGLGLAIVKEIVEMHRGTICASCPDDGGTSISVRLPLTSRN